MTFYAGPERGALALVESPAQLLNVIELAQHEDDLAAVEDRSARTERRHHP